mmetsp:Transcript_8618/g.26467  ORF Transcript_8618/g.26467 Transcript_8618/m.26467 type:complete len:445 (+) Transcript_8618:33-1367(+)
MAFAAVFFLAAATAIRCAALYVAPCECGFGGGRVGQRGRAASAKGGANARVAALAASASSGGVARATSEAGDAAAASWADGARTTMASTSPAKMFDDFIHSVRKPWKSPESHDDDLEESSDRVTFSDYERACDALREDVEQHGFLSDPRGVLVKEGVRDTRGDFKYVEFYKRDDGSWDAYLKKRGIGGQAIVLPTLAEQQCAWRLLGGVPKELPDVIVASDESLCRKNGSDVQAQVDVGIKLDLPEELEGWRAVVEVEINNLNLKDMNVRLVQYMRSSVVSPDLNPNWRRLRLAVGLEVYSPKRVDGTWVAICCVWRRGDGDVPTLERVFDVGTRNHDDNQDNATSTLFTWLRQEVRAGRVATSLNLFNFTVTPVPIALPNPLPPRMGSVVVPQTPELRKHFLVPLYAEELCFESGLPQDLIDQVPPFPINFFDIMLRHARLVS